MVKMNKVLTTAVIGATLTIGFTGCAGGSDPRPNVSKYINEHKLSEIPKDKNLEIIGYANNECNIEKIENIVINEYKAYDIKLYANRTFIGKGRVYKAATHNPTSKEIGRCYGALKLQQNYGRYRTNQQAKWYVNECIKGFQKIRTFDERLKIKHDLITENNIESLKLHITNANLVSDDIKEIGIYKTKDKNYIYSILPSFNNSKMKNFDNKIKNSLLSNQCIDTQINIPNK